MTPETPSEPFGMDEKDRLIREHGLDFMRDFWTVETPDGPAFRLRPHALAKIHPAPPPFPPDP